jgi:hypothetical protein
MTRTVAVAAALAILAGCSSKPQQAANNRDTMTRRQKDSVLAQSGIPGAAGVGMALKVADSVKAKQAAADSIKP